MKERLARRSAKQRKRRVREGRGGKEGDLAERREERRPLFSRCRHACQRHRCIVEGVVLKGQDHGAVHGEDLVEASGQGADVETLLETLGSGADAPGEVLEEREAVPHGGGARDEVELLGEEKVARGGDLAARGRDGDEGPALADHCEQHLEGGDASGKGEACQVMARCRRAGRGPRGKGGRVEGIKRRWEGMELARVHNGHLFVGARRGTNLVHHHLHVRV